MNSDEDLNGKSIVYTDHSIYCEEFNYLLHYTSREEMAKQNPASKAFIK